MFTITQEDITTIIVSDRSRVDFGDIKSLSESIKAHGLLYPIIINEQLELLEGERRLRACKLLEWPKIDCRIISTLTPDDKLIIELVGNIRKDFSWAEEISLKKKIHDQMTLLDSSWSYRKTATKLGCSLGGLSSDLEMAKVISTFPDLTKLPTKAKARDSYKKLQIRVDSVQAVKNLSKEDQQRLNVMLGKVKENVGGLESVNSVPTGQPVTPHAPDTAVGVTAPPNTCSPPNTTLTPSPMHLPPYTYKITDFKSFIRELPKNIVGFAELDPPYAIDFNATYGKTTKITTTEKDWTYDKLKVNMLWLFKKIYSKMLDNSWVLCWTGKEHWQLMNSLAEKANFTTQSPGVWIKPSGGGNSPKTTMISQYEMYLLMRKGGAQFNTPSFPSVISQNTVPSSERGHQWEKPIEVYDKFISACGRPGSVFLSPFAGSGSSMVSASLGGMTPMGCDIQQKYIYRFLEQFKNRCGGV